MLEMVVFAVTLVISNVIAAFVTTEIAMKRYMNKDTIKRYAKMAVEVQEELEDEMYNQEEES